MGLWGEAAGFRGVCVLGLEAGVFTVPVVESLVLLVSLDSSHCKWCVLCCCQESRVSYSTLRIICNMEGLNISHPLATRLMSLALMMHGRPADGETSRDRNIMRALCGDQNCTSLID